MRPHARRIGPLGLVAVLIGSLAACGGPRTVSHVSSKNDVFSYVITASLPLHVVGNPFGDVPADRVARAAAAGMSGIVNGRPLRFTVAGAGVANPHGYRTVLYLGEGGIIAGHALCGSDLSGPTHGSGTPGGPVRASAALCEGADMVAWAEGWGGAMRSPHSAAFRSLMSQLANAVFHREVDRPERDSDPWPG